MPKRRPAVCENAGRSPVRAPAVSRNRREWSLEDIEAYKRLLDAKEAEDLALDEMAEFALIEQSVREELDTVLLILLGKLWVEGKGRRVQPERREFVKDQLLRELTDRYRKTYARKRAGGKDEESARREALASVRRLTIQPAALPHIARPRGSLEGLLAAHERWCERLRPWRDGIDVTLREIGGRRSSMAQSLLRTTLLERVPEARIGEPAVLAKLDELPPHLLAAHLASRELGNGLTPPKAYAAVLRQKAASAALADPLIPGEEWEEFATRGAEEQRLRQLRDRLGPPPGLRDLWA